MDAVPVNRDRGRRKRAALLRPLPWWEWVVYVLAALLFVLGFLLAELYEYLPAGWRGDGPLTLRLPEVETLLLTAGIPFLVAACWFAIRRWWPEEWCEIRRLWSMRAAFVGSSILFASSAWATVINLTTPADQIPPHLPSFLAAAGMAAAGLLLIGVLLAAPELIVRRERAKRRQL